MKLSKRLRMPPRTILKPKPRSPVLRSWRRNATRHCKRLRILPRTMTPRLPMLSIRSQDWRKSETKLSKRSRRYKMLLSRPPRMLPRIILKPKPRSIKLRNWRKIATRHCKRSRRFALVPSRPPRTMPNPRQMLSPVSRNWRRNATRHYKS